MAQSRKRQIGSGSSSAAAGLREIEREIHMLMKDHNEPETTGAKSLLDYKLEKRKGGKDGKVYCRQ